MLKSPFAFLASHKQGYQPTELQARQESSQKHDATQESKSTEAFTHYSSKLLNEVMDGIPKVACVLVAVWDYFHTRDLQRFLFLLAASQANKPTFFLLRTLARGFIKDGEVV